MIDAFVCLLDGFEPHLGVQEVLESLIVVVCHLLKPLDVLLAVYHLQVVETELSPFKRINGNPNHSEIQREFTRKLPSGPFGARMDAVICFSLGMLNQRENLGLK